jgi:outer membrane protein assembly factor BamA
MLESPLATTTTWNFSNSEPALIDNQPAAFGRVREVSLYGAWRLPVLPFTLEVRHQTSGEGIGSDFEYRRTRVAMSGNLGLGQIASLVPQFAYGRLTESMVPQEAFYLGGSHSLRSVEGASLGGTGFALARLDLIGANDILEVAHIPHPAMFPIQLGLFAGIGAVWGKDPYGGPTVPGVDWPETESWLSEAGASLIYQPGLPDPTTSIRLNFAEALGPEREIHRWTISITRALDLITPFED